MSSVRTPTAAELCDAPNENAFFEAERTILALPSDDALALLLAVIAAANEGRSVVGDPLTAALVLGKLKRPEATGPLARMFVRLQRAGWPGGRSGELTLTQALRALNPGKKLKQVLRENAD